MSCFCIIVFPVKAISRAVDHWYLNGPSIKKVCNPLQVTHKYLALSVMQYFLVVNP